jgi:hypothetical protein
MQGGSLLSSRVNTTLCGLHPSVVHSMLAHRLRMLQEVIVCAGCMRCIRYWHGDWKVLFHELELLAIVVPWCSHMAWQSCSLLRGTAVAAIVARR